MKGLLKLCTVLSILVLFGACQRAPGKPAVTAGKSTTILELVKASESAAFEANQARSRKDMKRSAELGLQYSTRCLEVAPEEPACYYYRAVNTGLFYKANVLGYQVGVKQMIEDSNRVIELDESYDNGGAYRILGELFTKLPQTTTRVNGVTRDLERAENYLNESLRISSEYPENSLLLAENLLEQQKFTEAFSILSQAKQLVPQWKQDRFYPEWKTTTKKLEKQLSRRVQPQAQ